MPNAAVHMHLPLHAGGRHFGVTLFQRQRYDAIPTRDAEVLAASVRLALGEISRTTGLLRRRSDASSMTVFSDLCLATSLVTPVLGDFQRSNPELKIRLLSAADLAELPLLHVAYDNADWVDWPQFLEWFGTESPSRTDGMTFTSDQVCVDVAERGEGVALGWARIVQQRVGKTNGWKCRSALAQPRWPRSLTMRRCCQRAGRSAPRRCGRGSSTGCSST